MVRLCLIWWAINGVVFAYDFSQRLEKFEDICFDEKILECSFERSSLLPQQFGESASIEYLGKLKHCSLDHDAQNNFGDVKQRIESYFRQNPSLTACQKASVLICAGRVLLKYSMMLPSFEQPHNLLKNGGAYGTCIERVALVRALANELGVTAIPVSSPWFLREGVLKGLVGSVLSGAMMYGTSCADPLLCSGGMAVLALSSTVMTTSMMGLAHQNLAFQFEDGEYWYYDLTSPINTQQHGYTFTLLSR